MTQFKRRYLPIFLAVGLLCAAAPYRAAAEPASEAGMKDLFANTLLISVPIALWSNQRYLSPDHTYIDTGDGGEVKGTWVIENGKICVTPAIRRADQAARYCHDGLGKKVGEMWSAPDEVTGNPVLFLITPGRDR